jgi:signal recognition particle subunit SRP54
VKLVKDELTELMGGDVAGINLSGNPTVILMSGLQGSGKTTFPENYLLNKRIKPLLVACDIYRPAAIQQLYVVGDSMELRFIQNLRIRISRNCTKCN